MVCWSLLTLSWKTSTHDTFLEKPPDILHCANYTSLTPEHNEQQWHFVVLGHFDLHWRSGPDIIYNYFSPFFPMGLLYFCCAKLFDLSFLHFTDHTLHIQLSKQCRIEGKDLNSGVGPPVFKSQFRLSNYLPLDTDNCPVSLFISLWLSFSISLPLPLVAASICRSPLLSLIPKCFCEFQQIWHLIHFL